MNRNLLLLKQPNDLQLYNLAINNFKKDYSIENEESDWDHKTRFRFLCYKFIPLMRKIIIPKLKQNLDKEAVLIEFRKLPHLEFLIRNTINKLGNLWSYTVICGIDNYDYMNTMCKKISPNIKIIKVAYKNLIPKEYTKFITSLDFWNLLVGEKILIYQEDSIIFKNNINEFLDFDYIGAPWSKEEEELGLKNTLLKYIDINKYICVGNGGLTLRTKKCMIDVINSIKLDTSLDDYMPEDLYFSKTIQDLKLGKVADWDTAFKFSIEGFYNENSFGGHCFWHSTCKEDKDSLEWQKPLLKNVIDPLKKYRL